MKKYKFFYHYNKPASKEKGFPVITVHYKKKCLMVKNIVCNVPTKGKINKKQPFFVITGETSELKIENEIAYVN